MPPIRWCTGSQRMAKAVRRDIHKMHAFVRFRRLEAEDGERFVAWFEPEHHILRPRRAVLRRPLRARCAGRS